MLTQAPEGRPEAAWALAAGWMFGILAAVPFARDVVEWSNRRLAPGFLRWFSLVVVAIAGVWAVWRVVEIRKRSSRVSVLPLLLSAAGIGYIAFEMMDTPAEAVHFVQYCALALLVFRALAFHQRDRLIYANALLICGLAGLIDEIVQWLTPARFWDLRDVFNNAAASALALGGFWGAFRPPYIREALSVRSVRCFGALLSAGALLLGLCFFNTPARVDALSIKVPALAYLRSHDHVMTEFGYRHRVPDIGRFYSRFDLETLRALDEARAEEVGAILRRYANETPTNFLREYPPGHDPFAQEAVGHLHRRNHYFDVLAKYRFDPAAYAFHATVAWRENQILERYFGRSLAASGQAWTGELTSALEEHVRNFPYTSPVARHVIHRLSFNSIAAILGVALAMGTLLIFQPRLLARAPPVSLETSKSVAPPRATGGESEVERKKRWIGFWNWTAVVVWTAIIYATIPVARAIQYWVTDHWSRDAFSWFVYAFTAAALVTAALYLRKRAGTMSARQLVLLIALGVVFSAGTWLLRANPEEAMHFVQYGILSLLLYRAYKHRYGDRGAYVCAALLGAMLGTFDEIIQWIVPRRFFDFRDLAINAASGLLVQGALAGGLAPALMATRAGFRSARMAWRLAKYNLFIFFLIMSNTPEVWRPLYPYWPTLFVFHEAMTEYGYLHEDPSIGTFRSRFPVERIRAMDQARAEEAGEILRQWGRDEDYEQFLGLYSIYTDPFLYEMRIRLFRRDRYWNDAREMRHDPVAYAEKMTVAHGENRILETYYGHTLQAAGRRWTSEQAARAAAAASPELYDSPVSRELITICTMRQAQVGLLSLFLLAWVGGGIDVARRRARELRREAWIQTGHAQEGGTFPFV